MLMTLGEFTFELSTLAPSAIENSLSLSLPKHARHNGRPAVQFTGVDNETSKISGVLYPMSGITGTAKTLEQIRNMAKTGESYILAAADGYIKGEFSIKLVTEKSQAFDKKGTPLKIDFTIDLIRTDNERTITLDLAG